MKKTAKTYRAFASDNLTGDWVLAVGVGRDWVLGRYATKEEVVAVRNELVPGHIEDSGYAGVELLAPHQQVAEKLRTMDGFGDVGFVGEDTASVDLREMHRKRTARMPSRMLVHREADQRKEGRIVRMAEAKKLFGFAFDV